MWTKFWDMHSGGHTKEKPYEMIYIEAPKDEAVIIFYNRFGHNPNRVTCTCCGEDYSIDSDESLVQLSAFQRNCHYRGKGYAEEQNESTKKYVKGGEEGWAKYLEQYPTSKYMTMDEYAKQPDVLIISADEIKPSERQGELPEQGYVWID